MDRKGRYLDNIFVERLRRSLKYEEVYLNVYANVREAFAGMGKWLRFYNLERPHQALEYQTPMHVYGTGLPSLAELGSSRVGKRRQVGRVPPGVGPPATNAARGWTQALRYTPLCFFALWFLPHLGDPSALVFDEFHYVPAARALALLADDLNWEHPPLAKWLLGLSWRLLCDHLHWVSEPAAFRWVSVVFGLWALAAVGALMRLFGFRDAAASAAMWLTGFNFLWFVQSRTAMLDIFSLAFALWGVFWIRQGKAGLRPWLGWVCLGLAMACKWSAAPYCAVALFWAGIPWVSRAKGVALSIVSYLVPFLPLGLLAVHATAPFAIVRYHLHMLQGFAQVNQVSHPYLSHFWQWPTLLRPTWYHLGVTPAGERYVWAGGNPLLFLTALPATLWVTLATARRVDPQARALAVLYWAPLGFWAVLGRNLQLFYYFLPASMMLGPMVVWMLERLLRRASPFMLSAVQAGFVLGCGLLFLYFCPLFDGRLEPPRTYVRYMWLRQWI